MAERWGGGRPDGRAVFKVGTNKRDIELDDSRGGGMGMKMPEDETQVAIVAAISIGVAIVAGSGSSTGLKSELHNS